MKTGTEKADMCISNDDGVINIRAGAIIMKDGKFLMVSNEGHDYLYTVGGPLKFSETAEEAVKREVFEETRIHMEIDHLGFIHENYFRGDMPYSYGKDVYEIGYYFYMRVPDDFEPDCRSLSSDNCSENLEFVSCDDSRIMFPAFLRTELSECSEQVRFISTDDRIRLGDRIHVTIDRPYGSSHPNHPEMIYPCNYGYAEGVYGGDGEWQDVYVLGVDEPIREFDGRLIAVIHRFDDNEDKWVVCPDHMSFTEEEIKKAVAFQEQYFKTEIHSI